MKNPLNINLLHIKGLWRLCIQYIILIQQYREKSYVFGLKREKKIVGIDKWGSPYIMAPYILIQK